MELFENLNHYQKSNFIGTAYILLFYLAIGVIVFLDYNIMDFVCK